jgi:hypothetical protein
MTRFGTGVSAMTRDRIRPRERVTRRNGADRRASTYGGEFPSCGRRPARRVAEAVWPYGADVPARAFALRAWIVRTISRTGTTKA